MSSDQRSLDEFDTGGVSNSGDGPGVSTRPEFISWDRDANANDCRGCGAIVSRRFARVMGDNDDHVWACPNCVNQADLMNGAAADPEFERRCREGEP